MKKVCALLLILGSSFIYSIAQPSIKWKKSYGGSSSDYLSGVDLAKDGSYYMGGMSLSNDSQVTGHHSQGFNDFWIVKVDTSGKILWQRSLGGTNTESIGMIISTKDGGVISCGSTGSNDGDVSGNHGGMDIWVVKLNSQGSIQWQGCYGNTDWEGANKIIDASDGGYFVVGFREIIATSDYDMYIVKIDSSGKQLWEKTLGGSSNDYASCVVATKNGGCIVGGWGTSTDGDFSTTHGYDDFAIFELKSDGSLLRKKLFGGTSGEDIRNIKQTKDGGYITIGQGSSVDGDAINSGYHGGIDFWILKIDSAWNAQWQKCYGGSEQDIGLDIEEDVDGGYIAVGLTESLDGDVIGKKGNKFLYDMWAFKTDKIGNFIWKSCYGGKGNEQGRAMKILSNGEFLLGGYNDYNDTLYINDNHGGNDYWVLKMACTAPTKPNITATGNSLTSSATFGNQWYRNGAIVSGATGQNYNPAGVGGTYTVEVNNGCGIATSAPFLITGIDEQSTKDYAFAIYPNPFSETATLRYNLPPYTRKATLNIYDVRGSLVKSFLLDLSAGSTTISGEAFRNGVYFYDLVADGISAAKHRMVVLK